MKVRSWIVLGIVVGVGAGVVAAGITVQNGVNAEFRKLRESVVVPNGWTAEHEDTRLAGLFAQCVTSAFDVRPCPSSLVDYAVSGPVSESELRRALEDAGATVTSAECIEERDGVRSQFGDVCAAIGRIGDVPISIFLTAGPNPDVSSEPWGRLTIGR